MDISKVLKSKKLNQDDKNPFYVQMADIISAEIRAKAIPVGSKLPAERDLARIFGVSRTTAINAYRLMENQGLILMKAGSGTYVAEIQDNGGEKEFEVPWLQLMNASPQSPASSLLRELVSTPSVSDMISLAAGMADPDYYPLEDLKNLLDDSFEKLERRDFGHIPTEGYEPLRCSLANLMQRRGIKAKEENVLILSGSQQGLYLLAKTLLEPGDHVIMEAPTFIGALQVFREAGAKILSLPVGAPNFLALLEDYLIRYRPKMLYMMPTFQNPSGRVMDLAQREKLLHLAARHQLVIVEDDPYSELYFGEEPPPTLKALDSYGGVIYLSTLSKVMFPGLRTGFLIGPPVLINRLTLEKQYIDLHSGNISQMMVQLYLDKGKLESHLRKTREIYHKRRDFMAKALKRYCGDYIDFDMPDGGFYFWCRLKYPGSSRRLLKDAVKNGVYFVPGEAFYPQEGLDQEFRLCFTNHDERTMGEAIKRLARALVENKKVPSTGPREALHIVPQLI